MSFSYPPDDPANVGAIVTVLRAAARSQADAVDHLRRHAIRGHPPWHSHGGDAAVAEVGRLATLCGGGAAGLASAVAALTRYHEALLRARSGVDRLNQQYGAALFRRQRAAESPHPHGADDWSTELTRIERGHHAVLADLDTVSRQTARTLRQSLRPIGGRSDKSSVIHALARQLPMWERQTATELADKAAQALDPGHPIPPLRRAALMQKYTLWQDDPVFAKSLVERLGQEKFRELLADAVPPAYAPVMAPTLGKYYGFLGQVLGAARLGKKWLTGLTDGISDPNNSRQLIGLGLAMRHGTYQRDTIAALVPVLDAARQRSVRVGDPFGDPLIGVMHALASNPPVAAEYLRHKRPRLQELLSRVWAEDDGRALGALLAATSTLHTDDGRRIAEDTVQWVAGHVDSTPTGIYAGLGDMLGNYIDDVNHGLIDLRSGAPMVENKLPVTSGPPHAHFSQADLMRTLYVAMQSSQGAVSIYAHQAVYAAQQLERQTHSHRPSIVLSELAVNYGRLSKTHELALMNSATVANASEAERLRNRTSWISIASMAASVLPVPGVSGLASTAVGFTKGRTINYLAQLLKDRFYDKPLAHDSAKRFNHADQLAVEEEKATKKYVAALTKRLGGDPANTWISSQSIGAGRDNAEYVLKGVR